MRVIADALDLEKSRILRETQFSSPLTAAFSPKEENI
jgi:hypothetical protein